MERHVKDRIDQEIDSFLALQRKNKVMLVEDNSELRGLEADLLRDYGFEVYGIGDKERFDALMINGYRADLYILDGQTPLRPGGQPQETLEPMVRKIRELHPESRIVVKSGQIYEGLAKQLRIDVMPKGIGTISDIASQYF